MLKGLSIRHCALAAVLVCVGCAAQTSNDARVTSNQSFKSVDADGNGTLSHQELQTWLDTDKNGEVSLDEWNQLMVDPADD